MTTELEKAARQALEALEICAVRQEHQWHGLQRVAITKAALRRALEQQCVCGDPSSPGTHRIDGPCYAEQPAQQWTDETAKVPDEVWVTPKLRPLAKLAKELDGVIADVEQGDGFDDVCLDTVKYVRDELTEQPAQQEIDWKDQYEKQKRRAEMWIAKYEADIGPVEKAGPVAAQQEPWPQEPAGHIAGGVRPARAVKTFHGGKPHYVAEQPAQDMPKIGCVNHDCDVCKAQQEPVAMFKWLPDGATHISKISVSPRAGGYLAMGAHAFKYDNEVLKVYVTDNDNEYPGWRDAKDVFFHLNFPILPLYTRPQAREPQEPVECMCGICKLGKRELLADEQIDMIYTGIRAVHGDIDSLVFARAIEAAHGIGDKK